jgi:hypothetical protein
MEDLKPEDIFLLRIHQEAIDLGYGMVSVSVIIRNGQPILSSVNVHRAKRTKFNYKIDKI